MRPNSWFTSVDCSVQPMQVKTYTLLLVFEDVHWADDALMELLDYLVAASADHPVVFLALARPEFLETRPGFGAGLMGQTTLPLEPLTPPRRPRGLGPLAAEPDRWTQLVSAPRGTRCSWRSSPPRSRIDADAGELPTTVRAAIAARIDALPAEARTGLLHASVVGQSFWRGVVESIGELDDIDGALEALESRGLVQRQPDSQVAGDVEYAFKHVLIRDVAYATLPRSVRRDLHAATAGVIESSVPDPNELAWVLALHWREAGETSRAMEYLIAAGDRALARWRQSRPTICTAAPSPSLPRMRIGAASVFDAASRWRSSRISRARTRSSDPDPRARWCRRGRGHGRSHACDVLDGAS